MGHDLSTLLRLSLSPGVGPVLSRRILDLFSPRQIQSGLSEADLQRVLRIGEVKSRQVASFLRSAADHVDRELERAERAGVRLIPFDSPDYPPLLRELPAVPLLLYVRGSLNPAPDRAASGVGIVGSRKATAYGIEQAERFSALLAESGLTIVSGGARGIDTAAHRAALRVKGHTIVVKGCGLCHAYPPENEPLFDEIVEAGGAVVSELPMSTAPDAKNFPARNRIISGLSLGVLVIEAPKGSGALITARYALDDHGREVMAIPGRIDSRSSEGANDLIRKGEAALVMSPADVIDQLESQARHLFEGTHAARYSSPCGAAAPGCEKSTPNQNQSIKTSGLSPSQSRLVEALAQPRSLDELTVELNREAGEIQADLTLLEIRRIVVRQGGKLVARS